MHWMRVLNLFSLIRRANENATESFGSLGTWEWRVRLDAGSGYSAEQPSESVGRTKESSTGRRSGLKCDFCQSTFPSLLIISAAEL